MAYNPGMQYTGDRSLFAGMSGLGEGLAAGIKDAAMIRKEIGTNAKAMRGAWNAFQQSGFIPAGDGPENYSDRQLSEMFTGVGKSAMIASQLMGEKRAQEAQNWKAQEAERAKAAFETDQEYKRAQIARLNTPEAQFVPSFMDLNNDGEPDVLMTSRNSAQYLPSKTSKPGPTDVGPQGARVRYSDGSVGVWDGYRYKVQQPRLVSNETLTPGTLTRGQVAEDVSGLPLYGAGTPAPAPAPAAPTVGPVRQPVSKEQSALEWARSNPTDPRSAAILRKLGL